jgi:hypothetical protein
MSEHDIQKLDSIMDSRSSEPLHRDVPEVLADLDGRVGRLEGIVREFADRFVGSVAPPPPAKAATTDDAFPFAPSGRDWREVRDNLEREAKATAEVFRNAAASLGSSGKEIRGVCTRIVTLSIESEEDPASWDWHNLTKLRMDIAQSIRVVPPKDQDPLRHKAPNDLGIWQDCRELSARCADLAARIVHQSQLREAAEKSLEEIRTGGEQTREECDEERRRADKLDSEEARAFAHLILNRKTAVRMVKDRELEETRQQLSTALGKIAEPVAWLNTHQKAAIRWAIDAFAEKRWDYWVAEMRKLLSAHPPAPLVLTAEERDVIELAAIEAETSPSKSKWERVARVMRSLHNRTKPAAGAPEKGGAA